MRLIAEIGRQESEVGNITSILATQGPSAPHCRALMDKLGQVQGRREELEKQIQKLDCEVVELESRQIDAEIIRRNLESFSGFYAKLPPPQQKELLALLVAEVVFDTQASKIETSQTASAANSGASKAGRSVSEIVGLRSGFKP